MSLLLSEDFETGSNGTAVTTSNTIADLVGGGPIISTAWSITGTRSMDCNASGSSVTWRVPLGSLRAVVVVVDYFTIVGSITPSATAGLAVVRAGGTAQADVQILTNGRIRIRNGGTQVWAASSALPTDTDLRLEYVVDSAGTQQAAVYLKHGTTPIAGQSSGPQTYTGGTNDTVVMGVTTAATYHVRHDAFRVYTAAGDLPAPLATPPTVDIGANPTIQDYHAYAFTPTVTGNNGTTTYAWSVLSGPSTSSSQFSSTSTKNTTFTPGGGPGSYVLQLRVHDDSGDTDGTATVIVTALQDADRIAAVTLATSWTPSAGTADDCLADDDSATYVTSSNNPSSLDLKFTMRGIVPPPGDATVTLRDLQRSGGTGTVDVSLYKPDGSTLVKKISGVTVPTTMADTVVTFAAADLSGVTAADWRAGMVVLVEATAS